MSKLYLPKRVQLDLHPSYDSSNTADQLYVRIGVATAVDLCGDVLYVRAGVGDSKDHNELASKVDPGSDKNIVLPSGMYAKQGIVTTWYYPNMGDRLGGLAGPMVKKGLNPEANLTREQTTQCLKMAALAIGLFVVQPPHEVLKQEDLSKIMVDEIMLTEADKQFGRYITS